MRESMGGKTVGGQTVGGNAVTGETVTGVRYGTVGNHGGMDDWGGVRLGEGLGHYGVASAVCGVTGDQGSGDAMTGKSGVTGNQGSGDAMTGDAVTSDTVTSQLLGDDGGDTGGGAIELSFSGLDGVDCLP